MEDQIKKLVAEGKNASEIARLVGVHRTTVGKWIKKLGLCVVRVKHTNCDRCSRQLGDNPKNNTKCKTCFTQLRRYRIKQRAVEYKGQKCEHCGYSEHLAALQFHHIDPTEKDFAISSIQGSYSWERMVKELDKCELLCANCHAVEHSKYDDLKK